MREVTRAPPKNMIWYRDKGVMWERTRHWCAGLHQRTINESYRTYANRWFILNHIWDDEPQWLKIVRLEPPISFVQCRIFRCAPNKKNIKSGIQDWHGLAICSAKIDLKTHGLGVNWLHQFGCPARLTEPSGRTDATSGSSLVFQSHPEDIDEQDLEQLFHMIDTDQFRWLLLFFWVSHEKYPRLINYIPSLFWCLLNFIYMFGLFNIDI